MKRELKFRVWNTASNSFLDLTAGEWGYYYLTLDGKFKVHYNGGFGNPTEIKDKELNYMVVHQYTSVHDKNGKEIYEGDVLNYRGRIGRVEFFSATFFCSWDDQTESEIGYMTIDDMEVVGNIFESLDLPKEESPTTVEEDELELNKCEQCGEDAWDGYICHVCGLKYI